MLDSLGVVVKPNDKELSIQKEKMSAEFKDCHLYLTYLRLGFLQFMRVHPHEYDFVKHATRVNYDVKAIVDLFESRIPAVLDFAEHLHFKNVSVLEYMMTLVQVA